MVRVRYCLSLDEDVVDEIRKRHAATGKPLSDVVNDSLRIQLIIPKQLPPEIIKMSEDIGKLVAEQMNKFYEKT